MRDWKQLVALAEMAETRMPAKVDSPGAEFLFDVWEAYEEITDEELIAQYADGCVPIYTYEMWETFLDLAGWEQDMPEWTKGNDMTRMAMGVLYTIAERLLLTRWSADHDD